jgi:DNA polymerase-1
LPSWIRGLIRPAPGRNLTYLDYTQQEYAVAAVLSGDTAMLQAYEQGDVYLDFAKQAGAVPDDATKASHPEVRSLFKQFVLATQYGQGPQSLAIRLKMSPLEAGNLLQQHRRAYRRFWEWSDAVEKHALLAKSLHTVFGWNWHVPTGTLFNPRSARNFPVQANAAEMLRLGVA